MKDKPHNVAVLRKMLGLSQKKFADLVGKTVATIQSIELGRLNLSEGLALEISNQTGVSPDWLLSDDPSETPYADGDLGSVEYSKDLFDDVQAAKSSNVEYIPPDNTPERMHAVSVSITTDFFPVYAAAVQQGKGREAAYLMERFIRQVRERFGYDEEFAARLSGKAALVYSNGDQGEFVHDSGGSHWRKIKGQGMRIRIKK